MIRLPRPVSLFALMQRFEFRSLVHLASIEGILDHSTEDEPLADVVRPSLRNLLKNLDSDFAHLGFVASAATAERMRTRVDDPKTTYGQLKETCSDLLSRLLDEAFATVFLSIDSDKTKFYTETNLFGAEVAERLAPAIGDIEEAGKCLALDRGTACVFHLMRVMEVGLKRLASDLGIPYAPSWESYIDQINTRIAQKHKKKGIHWKRDEPYFKEIVGDLLTVKVAWRNPTMHIVRTYTPDEADQVFAAVRTLMQRVAVRAKP